MEQSAEGRSNMITLAGGTGLVGKTLTQALVRDGEQVRVLTRDPNAAAAAFGDAKLENRGRRLR
jgi:NAD(P)H dehydrogenase (quinone)